MIHDHSTDRVRFMQIHLGGDRNFCYLIGDPRAGTAAAVDPGFEPERMRDIAATEGLTIARILITHGHADHTAGTGRLRELTGAEVHAGPEERVPGALPLTDGQVLELGQLSITALATPGHSPGHFCFLCEDRLVTGDILFCGKVGGTGSFFPGSSARQEYDSLNRLMKLPPDTMVFPGHDYYGGPGQRPSSTIGHEKENNPFLTAPDFEAFCHLKDNWAAYKKEHNLR
jgi:glyoxylase-like metal-dependent hydrolase (beta-lactamase superfamily II)